MFSKMFLMSRIHYGAKLIAVHRRRESHTRREDKKSFFDSFTNSQDDKKKVSLDLFVSLPPFPPRGRLLLSYLIFPLVPLFSRSSFFLFLSLSLRSRFSPPLPLFLAPSIFSQSPSPFFHLFPNCLYVRPLRTKEGETGADNDLMYGPVMSLVGGRTPLFPLRNEEQITRVDRITRQRKVRKHEIFIRKIPARAALHPVSMYSNRLRRYRDTRARKRAARNTFNKRDSFYLTANGSLAIGTLR